MQISELLAKCTLADSDMNEVLSANPKQIISDSVEIPCWRVSYEYDIARGNKKDGIKYLFLAESAWDLVEPEFNKHIEQLNEKRPCRQGCTVPKCRSLTFLRDNLRLKRKI